MLKKRVIPIVLIDGFSVLKTINFKTRRNLGSPITVVRTYNTRNVDELIILDIDAAKQGRSIDKFTVAEMARECFMPLTVGGGVNKLSDIEMLLAVGADKVSINTALHNNPEFVKEAVNTFGSQCIVASLDFDIVDGVRRLVVNNNIKPIESIISEIRRVEDLGVGELLINDIANDGLMQGADIEFAKFVCATSNLPTIFAGGISSLVNVYDTVRESDCSAIAASSIFHFTSITPNDCSAELMKNNIPARKLI